MLSDIIVAVMCVIAFAAGFFVWRMESAGTSVDQKKDEDKKINPEEMIKRDGE